MAIPDMQMLERDSFARRNQTGFENASAVLLRTFVESLLSEICRRTSVHVFSKLAVDCECMRADALTWLRKDHFKASFKGCIDEPNKCDNTQHEWCEDTRGLPAIQEEIPSQHIGGKSEGQRYSAEISLFSTCRSNVNAQFLIRPRSLRTSVLSDDKEEEDDSSGRCRAGCLNESIENLERIQGEDIGPWISVAKNKDDDDEEEEDDDDDEDEEDDQDDDDDDDDDEGDGGDDAKGGEDLEGGEDEDENGDDEDADDDELDDGEGDDEDDEEEDEDEEEEAPPKKKKK